MTLYFIPGGLRVIPASLLASGQSYSMALHGFIEHNQELIANTIMSRQLVNDYYPNTSNVCHSEVAAPSGSMIAQWGRFEAIGNMMLTCRVFAAMNTDTYSDDTSLHVFCTPKLLNPNTSLAKLLDSYSEQAIHYATDNVDSTTYAYYTFSVLPNQQKGKQYYVSLWKQSADPGLVDSSEIYLRFASICEEPIQ